MLLFSLLLLLSIGGCSAIQKRQFKLSDLVIRPYDPPNDFDDVSVFKRYLTDVTLDPFCSDILPYISVSIYSELGGSTTDRLSNARASITFSDDFDADRALYFPIARCYSRLMSLTVGHSASIKPILDYRFLPRQLRVALKVYWVALKPSLSEVRKNDGYDAVVATRFSNFHMFEYLEVIKANSRIADNQRSNLALSTFFASLFPGSDKPVHTSVEFQNELAMLFLNIGRWGDRSMLNIVLDNLRLKQRSSEDEVHAVLEILIRTDAELLANDRDYNPAVSHLSRYLLGVGYDPKYLPRYTIKDCVENIVPELVENLGGPNSGILKSAFAGTIDLPPPIVDQEVNAVLQTSKSSITLRKLPKRPHRRTTST